MRASNPYPSQRTFFTRHNNQTARQMGLCFEALRQDKMAAEAYHQAWNTLLEQYAAAAAGQDPSGAQGANTTRTGGYHSGAFFEPENKEDGRGQAGAVADGSGDGEIGRILSQAKGMLANVGESPSVVTAGGWSRGSTPGQGVLRQGGGKLLPYSQGSVGELSSIGDRRDVSCISEGSV